MEMAQLRCILGGRFIKHCAFLPTYNFRKRANGDWLIEYMDDFVVDDPRWLVLVAVVDMCLDGIFYRSLLRLSYRSDWSCIPYLVSRHGSSVLWNLGIVLAGA